MLGSVSGFGPDFGVFFLEALFLPITRFGFSFFACENVDGSWQQDLDASLTCWSGALGNFQVPLIAHVACSIATRCSLSLGGVWRLLAAVCLRSANHLVQLSARRCTALQLT